MDEPEISYPRTWTYRIVASDEEAARARVDAVLGERPRVVARSRLSAAGSYVSLRLDVEVSDQADRDAIFAALKSDASIKWVL